MNDPVCPVCERPVTGIPRFVAKHAVHTSCVRRAREKYETPTSVDGWKVDDAATYLDGRDLDGSGTRHHDPRHVSARVIGLRRCAGEGTRPLTVRIRIADTGEEVWVSPERLLRPVPRQKPVGYDPTSPWFGSRRGRRVQP